MRFAVKFWALLLLATAGSGRSLAATMPELPGMLDSGWVLADLNGDQNVDLAAARSGHHDANGYSQEVRITLGAYQQTSFRFLSPGATVELSSRDVDGDQDRDLVILEPVSRELIGVWINDGTGSFHEGRLADFRKLWSEHPGPGWRVRVQPPALLAISEERTQFLTLSAVIAAPEPIVVGRISRNESPLTDTYRSAYRPRGPPRNS